MSNDFKPSGTGIQNYIDLNVDATLEYAEGRLMWDKENDTVVIYNSESEIALQVGQELWRTAVNNTGSTITNGSVVYISGFDLTNNKPTVGLANSNNANKALSTIAVATHDVENGTVGFFTRIGTVRGLNTSGCSAGERLFLSTTDGQYTNVAPETPNYLVSIGNCSKVDAVDGTLEIDINVFNNKQNATDIFNGCIQDKAEVSVSSDGVDITLSVQKSGGGDLVLYFNNIPETFDCTPPQTVTLTAGSDESPVENYVYIPESTKVLTVGSSYPSSQYVAIARVIVGSASRVQSDGTYKFHVYTDELKNESGQGHVQHVNAKLREDFASYRNGVAPTVTKVTQPSAIDNLYWSNSSGEVWQLHPQSFPALDTQVSDHVHVINDFTTKYNKITDLSSVSLASDGTDLRTNNSCYALVIWGTVSETLNDSQIYVNAPSGKYGTVLGATDDINGYTSYDIPTEYKGVGFLIARVILQYQTVSSGTFATVTVKDLRGKTPNTTAGGGGGSTGGITPVWGGATLIPYTNATNDNYNHDSTFKFNSDASNKEVAMNVLKINPIADASIPTHFEGYVYYNSDYDTFSIYTDIATDSNFRGIFIGKMQFMHIYNDTGATLTRGSVVAWNSTFSSVLPTVVLADADLHEAEDVAGFVIKNISDTSSGIICTSGWLINTDLDYITTSPSSGDTLYLSTTAGEADTSLPASPAKQVVLGKYLAVSGTEHNIFVSIAPTAGSGSATTEFSDAEFRVQDNSDATKEFAFECSGITTGTTQTLTIPNTSGTIALTGATQTLTNKTISGDNNTITGVYSIPHKNTALTYGSATTVTFTADILVVGDYVLTNVNETATMPTDLDTGSEAASTWYNVIITTKLGGADPIAILSTSKTSSNLPTDYVAQRFVGSIYNNSSSNFDEDRTYSCFNNFVSLNTRTFLSITTTGVQNLDISDYVPPSAYSLAIVLILDTSNTASNITLFSKGGDSTSAYTSQVNQYVASQPISDGALAGVNSSGNITYSFNLSGTNEGTRIEIGGFYQKCD